MNSLLFRHMFTAGAKFAESKCFMFNKYYISALIASLR
jgi:hypothetical protein